VVIDLEIKDNIYKIVKIWKGLIINYKLYNIFSNINNKYINKNYTWIKNSNK